MRWNWFEVRKKSKASKYLKKFKYGIATIVLIIILDLLLYHNVFTEPFSLDDAKYIKFAQDFTKEGVGKGIIKFFTWGPNPVTYRPISSVIYSLMMWRFFGPNSLAFHLANLIIFIISSILIFIITKKITNNILLSFLTAFIYTTRTSHAVAVIWISCIEETMMAFFGLLSILFYISFAKDKNRSYLNKKFILSLIFFFLSLFSKENAIIIPILLILYERFFSKKDFETNRIIKKILPFIIIIIFYLFLRYIAVGLPVGPRMGWGKIDFSPPNLFHTLLRYLTFPFDIYTSNITQLASVFVLLFATIIYVSNKMKISENKILLFGILWFLICLLPFIYYISGVSGFRLSIANFGFSLFWAYILVKVIKSFRNRKQKKLFIFIFLFSVFLISFFTVPKVWKNIDVAEASEINKVCVPVVSKIPANSTVVVTGDVKKLQWASDDGILFNIMYPSRNLTIYFQEKLSFKHISENLYLINFNYKKKECSVKKVRSIVCQFGANNKCEFE